MRVLVCGGRDFDSASEMDRIMSSIPLPSLVITGAQRKRDPTNKRWIGADWLAIEWAQRNEVPFAGFPAKWTTHGNAAGPIRNGDMLRRAKPDLVVSLPGGNGTANMVKQAKAAGIDVREF
jgi:hypothetical protein